MVRYDDNDEPKAGLDPRPSCVSQGKGKSNGKGKSKTSSWNSWKDGPLELKVSLCEDSYSAPQSNGSSGSEFDFDEPPA